MLFRLWVLLEFLENTGNCFNHQLGSECSFCLPCPGRGVDGSLEVAGSDSQRGEVMRPESLRKTQLGWLPGHLLSLFLRHAPSLNFSFWTLASPLAEAGEQKVSRRAESEPACPVMGPRLMPDFLWNLCLRSEGSDRPWASVLIPKTGVIMSWL